VKEAQDVSRDLGQSGWQLEAWRRRSSLAEKSLIAREPNGICDTLRLLQSYDGLNLVSLSGVEHLVRQLRLTQLAAKRSPASLTSTGSARFSTVGRRPWRLATAGLRHLYGWGGGRTGQAHEPLTSRQGKGADGDG
jgi:hypothetical protein